MTDPEMRYSVRAGAGIAIQVASFELARGVARDLSVPGRSIEVHGPGGLQAIYRGGEPEEAFAFLWRTEPSTGRTDALDAIEQGFGWPKGPAAYGLPEGLDRADALALDTLRCLGAGALSYRGLRFLAGAHRTALLMAKMDEGAAAAGAGANAGRG